MTKGQSGRKGGPFIFKTQLTKLHFVLTTRTVVIITEGDDCGKKNLRVTDESDAKSTDIILKCDKNNNYG